MLTDEQIIKQTLKLAEKGRIWVHPNPMVGAVLMKDGRIVETGYHHHYGGPHAEIDLLIKARESAKGGILYVNLEPCCHYGKTGPCTSAVIAAGLKEVVTGDSDPNPMVNGKGIALLRKAGIKVRCGILKKECRDLNRVYYKYMKTGIPYVSVKIAMTLDGKINCEKNKSTAITGLSAQEETHQLRAEHDAILIGSRTAKIDNPQLTVRLIKGRSPIRVVLDSRLNLPLNLQLFKRNKDTSTIIAATAPFNKKKFDDFVDQGIDVVTVTEDKNEKISIPHLLKKLAKKHIASILVEGGAEIYSSFFSTELVDRCYFFIAPKMFGTGLDGLTFMNNKINKVFKNNLKFTRIKSIGEDILIEAEINPTKW